MAVVWKGNKKLIIDDKEREALCTCWAEKMAANVDIKSTFKKQLEAGNIDKVMKALETSESLLALEELRTCATGKEIEWNPSIENEIKATCLKDLKGTEFEQIHDVDKFCSCVVQEYRNYPLSTVLYEGFQESELANAIADDCAGKSILEVKSSVLF